MTPATLTAAEQNKARPYTAFEGAWPSNIPKLEATPEELLAKTLSDLDALPMVAMGIQIDKLRSSPDQTQSLKSQIANLEFGYWNKVTVAAGRTCVWSGRCPYWDSFP